MAVAAQPMAMSSLRLIHRETIDRADRVRALLEQLRATGVPLHGGIDGQINERRAVVRALRSDRLVLVAQHFQTERLPQLFLRFELGGRRYFFAADVIDATTSGRIEVRIPEAIHEVERRDLPRHVERGPSAVELTDSRVRVLGRVIDRSYDGVGIRVEARVPWSEETRLDLKHLAGSDTGERHGIVRNRHDFNGWTRLGLSVSSVPFGRQIEVEHRKRILDIGLTDRAKQEFRFYGAAVGSVAQRLARTLTREAEQIPVQLVSYPNDKGQTIKAIVDQVGSGAGATAVIVPPAWGRTKETLLPAAAILCETFARAGEALAVLRYDGTNRRGESWIDPECRTPGNEYLHFRFSQSVRDLHAGLDWLQREIRPAQIIVLTTSLGSIEGRRAVATDPTGLVAGWVSLVGMVDLHSGLRAASGGIDYAYGLQAGASFGRHEIAGVVADMDLTGRDVMDNDLGLFEDARRDMAAIRVPVTWIHGRHDGWIDLPRVRALMSSGDMSNRRLIEVPSGHQLRTSRMALETFQLVAEEVARMALRRAVEPAMPSARTLEARRRAERTRRPRPVEDLQEFWKRYVLGRDESLGIEILAATRAYQDLMAEQIARLELREGERVLDLGSGAGDFAVSLLEAATGPRHVSVVAVDFIRGALRRGLARARTAHGRRKLALSAALVDLEHSSLPFPDGSFDAILASLVISYLTEPDRMLQDMHRVLRPGGRVVVSCPKRDADLSKIYVDGIRELDSATVRRQFGRAAELRFAELQRNLLNEGARLLMLEDEGWFQFWDADELEELVQRQGFVAIESTDGFGNPPQVSLVAAMRN